MIKSVLRKLFQIINSPLVKRRQRLLSEMPRVDLTNQHTAHGRLLATRFEMLDLMPKNATVAEIGVADGDFSDEILKRCSPKALFLIDLWSSDRYRDGKDVVKNRFRKQIGSGQVILRPGYSTEVLKDFHQDAFDWVYIDTDHTYATTAQELLLAERVVKKDGKILGHDFCTASAGRGVVYGVVQAVNEFCVSRSWGFDYIALDAEGHFSFCLSRSAFDGGARTNATGDTPQ
jgi:hypothetical protein